MNRKFVISAAVMFVLSMLLGFVVHALLLQGDYAKLPSLMRTAEDSQKHFHYMLLAHAFLACGFTWIYLKGMEAGKPWLAQGLRFGIAVSLLAPVPMYLIYFAVMPFPSDLVAQQIVFDSISYILMALVLAWMNR